MLNRESIDLLFLLEGHAKNVHLPALDGAAERLRLFKADLLDYGSMAAAVAGCDVVFHVACPVLVNPTPNPEAHPSSLTPLSQSQCFFPSTCSIICQLAKTAGNTRHVLVIFREKAYRQEGYHVLVVS
jgi:hypothetical protein